MVYYSSTTNMKKLTLNFLKQLANFVFNVLYSVKVIGLENVPKGGRCILAANHASLLDPMVMFYVTPRKFYAVTAKWLFEIRFISWALKAVDCIPTNGSCRGAVATLEREDMILIFPQGRCATSKEEPICPKPHKGAAFLALKTGSPVIPIGINGTFEAWPIKNVFPSFFRKIEIRVGPPIFFERYPSENIPLSVVEENLGKIVAAIKKLVE